MGPLRCMLAAVASLCLTLPAAAVTVTKINVEVPQGADGLAAGTNRIVLETDEDPKFNITDATADPAKQYWYVDIYGLSKTYNRRLLSPDNAALRHIDFICPPQYQVLRIVLYVKPGAKCAVEKTTSPSGLVITCASAETVAGSQPTTGSIKRESLNLAPAPEASSQARLSAPGSQPRSPLPGSFSPPSKTPPGAKKVVIIDPGHGGANSGADSNALVAGKRALEKDLTLAFAHQLKKIIDQPGTNMVAIVTRSEDTNMGLQDRVHFAESRMGDLFISIHMNDGAGNPSARGFEVYYLDQKGAATAAAKAVEERENKEVGTPTRKHSKSLLDGILTDISRGQLDNMKVESQLFCQHLSRQLTRVAHFKDHNRGIKSANFVVLKNFAMPSVLLEVGFITNTEDLKLLVDPRFQQATAAMVYNGIAYYFAQNDPTFKARPAVIGGKK